MGAKGGAVFGWGSGGPENESRKEEALQMERLCPLSNPRRGPLRREKEEVIRRATPN